MEQDVSKIILDLIQKGYKLEFKPKTDEDFFQIQITLSREAKGILFKQDFNVISDLFGAMRMDGLGIILIEMKKTIEKNIKDFKR